MKRTVILWLALVFFGVCMAPIKAVAHNGEHEETSSVSTYHNPTHSEPSVSSKAESTKSFVSVPSETSTKRNCNGTCCGMSVCCMSGVIPSSGWNIFPNQGRQALIFNQQAMTQGPLYPLFRPPRLSV
jgi:hypothetical protein